MIWTGPRQYQRVDSRHILGPFHDDEEETRMICFLGFQVTRFSEGRCPLRVGLVSRLNTGLSQATS